MLNTNSTHTQIHHTNTLHIMKAQENASLISINKAQISEGPYGLISIKVNGNRILINENGLFDKYGNTISTSKAKNLLGL